MAWIRKPLWTDVIIRELEAKMPGTQFVMLYNRQEAHCDTLYQDTVSGKIYASVCANLKRVAQDLGAFRFEISNKPADSDKSLCVEVTQEVWNYMKGVTALPKRRK